MDYAQDMIGRLLDSYERRAPNGGATRAVALNIKKTYPGYGDGFGPMQDEIDGAVARLTGQQLVRADKDLHGYYPKVQLETDRVGQAYRFAGREPKSDRMRRQRELVLATYARTKGVAQRFCAHLLHRLDQGKLPDYGIGDNCDQLRDILLVLEKLEQLKTETYIRNFSEAIFHDSKRFQAMQSAIQRILLDHTQEAVDEKTVLERYNLITNPHYVYLKGGWIIECGDTVLDLTGLPGGIGLPSGALGCVTTIRLACDTVLSVENLTTYHDVSESDGAILYLGGFHNSVRTDFLKQLYRAAPHARYFHKGDLDPYGFLILENLKQKTQIPFQPLEMDIETLRRCYAAGHYRPLDGADKKAMASPLLAQYADIFAFMRQHDCKVEQECFEAMKLEL